ncbi:MAG TPA: dynamin family protein [Chloroflexia bacterium]|nr:dynamin family protein [Chloroflexia bacterium]
MKSIDILDDQETKLRAAERDALRILTSAISPLEPDVADLEALRQAEADLEELFMLVIVGEFNSGKSTFINALLGAEVLPEGVTPTTATINLLRYGDTVTEHQSADFVTDRTYPAEFLREISIVDTPGTNAIIRRHEELTRTFVPRSDMVLFITSADRPFTESERAFMETIKDWGKKIVLILNKIDLLASEEDLQRVMHFIAENSVVLLGQKPEIFPVSARLAKRARATDTFAERDALLKASRMDVLEKYIFSTLDEAGRIRLKLSTPLGVANRVLERYQTIAHDRLDVLAEDFKTVQNIEDQLRIYSDDMKREFEGRLANIENIVYELKERGDLFFNETLRVGRIRDLLNSKKIESEFQKQVVADTAQRVDDATNGLIDWMVDQDLRMWQNVTDYVNKRQAVGVGSSPGYNDKLVGNVGMSGVAGFAYNRDSLLRSVVKEARHVVETYDRDEEATIIAQNMRNAVGVMLGAGGVAALGVIVAATVTVAFLDVTGITAAILAGAIGLFVLPFRKRKAQEDFRARTQELRDKLGSAMTAQFNTELTRSVDRIHQAIAPYTRFVRLEQERVSKADAQMTEVDGKLSALRQQIELIGR